MGLSSQLAPSAIAKPGVIANAAARPASPYDGQVIYQQDTDQAYVWNGSAWVLLSTGTANPPGLEFISTTTVGSAVASVDITSCFNNTYDNYRIVYSNINGSTNHDLTTVLLSSTTPSTTAYYRGFIYVSLTTNAVTGSALQNAGSFPVSSTSTTSFRHAGVIEFYMPNLAQYTGIWSTNYLMRTDITSPGVSGSHQVATAYDGFRISTTTGTMTGGTISVYGYKK